MHPWIEKMVRQVQTVPPACLGGFRTTLLDTGPWNNWASWSARCVCGENKGHVLGYSLRDFSPEYEGAEFFISPLGFRCVSCGKTTEVIDTGLHGYNAEISKLDGGGGDSNVRGAGERKSFPCPQCRGQVFLLVLRFAHAHFDLMEDEPELEPRAQDFFDAFACEGTCVSCDATTNVTNFELA